MNRLGVGACLAFTTCNRDDPEFEEVIRCEPQADHPFKAYAVHEKDAYMQYKYSKSQMGWLELVAFSGKSNDWLNNVELNGKKPYACPYGIKDKSECIPSKQKKCISVGDEVSEKEKKLPRK